MDGSSKPSRAAGQASRAVRSPEPRTISSHQPPFGLHLGPASTDQKHQRSLLHASPRPPDSRLPPHSPTAHEGPGLGDRGMLLSISTNYRGPALPGRAQRTRRTVSPIRPERPTATHGTQGSPSPASLVPPVHPSAAPRPAMPASSPQRRAA